MPQNREGMIYSGIVGEGRDVRKSQIMWKSAENCRMLHLERESLYLRGHSTIPLSLGGTAVGNGEELF